MKVKSKIIRVSRKIKNRLVSKVGYGMEPIKVLIVDDSAFMRTSN